MIKSSRVKGPKRTYSTIGSLKAGIETAHKDIKYAKEATIKANKDLLTRGSIVFNQFAKYVEEHRELYDDQFMVWENVEIDSVLIDSDKQAIAVHGKHGLYMEKKNFCVLVPFMFISNESAFTSARIIQVKFGKGTTLKDVDTHYESEINKLQEEIDKLLGEKISLGLTSKDWK